MNQAALQFARYSMAQVRGSRLYFRCSRFGGVVDCQAPSDWRTDEVPVDAGAYDWWIEAGSFQPKNLENAFQISSRVSAAHRSSITIMRMALCHDPARKLVRIGKLRQTQHIPIRVLEPGDPRTPRRIPDAARIGIIHTLKSLKLQAGCNKLVY